MMVGVVSVLALLVAPQDVRVSDSDALRRAIQAASPGTRVLIAPGKYSGDLYFTGVHGTAAAPIVIAGEKPGDPPVITGRGECMHLSAVSYLELRDLRLTGAAGNGMNIDDGGVLDKPSHHVTLRRIAVSDIGPTGNHDGLKLSGLDNFLIDSCSVERWGSGGSGIDMVGCHHGTIQTCLFRQGGSEGIQAKGGCADITISHCRFEEYGERGVNIGGSTGMPFFRPRIETVPSGSRSEAKDIRVEDSVFVGGVAPVAFVGVDGASVRRCVIYHPAKWALRILQETRDAGFLPSRNGVFEDNIVAFRSTTWFERGVNIGPGTAPQTFRFARNVWYGGDRPDHSKPTLPTPETGGLYGQDPLFTDPARGNFHLRPNSPAIGRGPTAR